MFRKMYQGGPSRKQGPRLAIRDAAMNHRGKLKCGLVNGLQRTLWIEQESRKNLTHTCVMLILRASRQISAASTTISLIPL